MAENVGSIYYTVTADTSQLIGEQRKVEKIVDSTANKFNALTLAVKVLAASYAMLKAAQLADDMRMLAARVEVAAGSFEHGAQAMSELEKISRRTQTAIADNAAVFTRLNQSLIQMGGTQSDTLRLTELLGKAIKVSGASAAEGSSAMLQFGQALGSGKLAGDELRSLLETAPYLMRQLADGIGVPVGALRKMGEEGELTADVVVNALSASAQRIDADFQKFPQTIAAAMTVATDAALRANEKLDELTGTSAALTGITQGLGKVLDGLADQFGAANTEAGKLGRNGAIAEWSQKTQTALIYVADAVDVTWQAISVLGRNVTYVFTAVGNEIGGIGAQIAAVMRGDFAGAKAIGDAMKQDADARRAELDKQDADTLRRRQKWGQQMRQTWNAGAGGGRGFVNPTAGASKITAPTGSTSDTGRAKRPFDAMGYMAGLSSKAASEWERVSIIENDAMRKNEDLLKAKSISQQQFEEARTLITQKATQDRQAIMATETVEFLDEMSRRYKLEQEQKSAREKGQDAAWKAIAGPTVDPVQRIREQMQLELDVQDEYRALDLENALIYEEAKQAIRDRGDAAIVEATRAEGLAKISAQADADTQSLNLMQSMADGAYMILEKSGKERTALGKTLFLASKALAIAEILINTEVAASKAGAQLGIFGLPMAAMIRAQGYASAGMVAGMALAGRQYGGPVSADSLYRVNEKGAPEMFTAANGSQYMMPTTSGRVTAADSVGGGAQWSIVVNNTAPGATASASVDSTSRTVTIAVQEVASQIRTNTGPVWSALKSATNTTSRL